MSEFGYCIDILNDKEKKLFSKSGFKPYVVSYDFVDHDVDTFDRHDTPVEFYLTGPAKLRDIPSKYNTMITVHRSMNGSVRATFSVLGKDAWFPVTRAGLIKYKNFVKKLKK